MAYMGYARANGCFDAQFLIKFADQSFFGALAGLHFSARKLPFKGHGLVGTALTDQYFVAAEDESGDYIANGFGIRRTGPLGFDILHAHTSLDGSASKLMQRICGPCAWPKISGWMTDASACNPPISVGAGVFSNSSVMQKTRRSPTA